MPTAPSCPAVAVTHQVALAIFLALSAACWFVALALYRSTVGGPDPAAAPHYKLVSAAAVGAAALGCLIPFPVGLVAGLWAWGTALLFLNLPFGRALVLFAYLDAGSVVQRLVVLGVLAVAG